MKKRIHPLQPAPLAFAPASNLRTASRLRLGDERGTALLLALVMLVILSVLGMLAISTATTEQKITGNFRSSREAFYAADRAVAYAGTAPDLFATGTTADLYADATHRNRIAADVGGLLAGLDPAASNTATFLGSGPPPAGPKSDATMFEARYTIVNVTGAFPATNLASRSRFSVETQIARIVPK